MTADIDARVDGDWVYVGSATEEMVENGTVPGGVREILRQMRADSYRYRRGTEIIKRYKFEPPKPEETNSPRGDDHYERYRYG